MEATLNYTAVIHFAPARYGAIVAGLGSSNSLAAAAAAVKTKEESNDLIADSLSYSTTRVRCASGRPSFKDLALFTAAVFPIDHL